MLSGGDFDWSVRLQQMDPEDIVSLTAILTWQVRLSSILECSPARHLAHALSGTVLGSATGGQVGKEGWGMLGVEFLPAFAS